MPKKYIDIDSTHRDRNQFPNPSNFTVMISQSGQRGTADTAYDFVVDSFPIHGDGVITFAGGVAAAPVLDATTSAQNNFYINHYLEDITLGEFRLITSYVGGTRTATLASAFGGGWAAGDTFRIRKSLPSRQSTLVGATTTIATLDAGASTTDDAYNNFFIWFPTTGELRRISDYDGTLQEATLASPIAAALGAVAYEILQFSRDNFIPFTNLLSPANYQEDICFEIQLLHLIIPNTTLNVSNGGTINDYPYIYVEFGNSTGVGNKNPDVLTSNNDAAHRALFKVPISDISNIASDFIKIGCDFMAPTVRFMPTSSFFFGVKLPNGEYANFSTADNLSPLSPNPALQISATFSFEEKVKQHKHLQNMRILN